MIGAFRNSLLLAASRSQAHDCNTLINFARANASASDAATQLAGSSETLVFIGAVDICSTHRQIHAQDDVNYQVFGLNPRRSKMPSSWSLSKNSIISFPVPFLDPNVTFTFVPK